MTSDEETARSTLLRRSLLEAAILGIEKKDYVDSLLEQFEPHEVRNQLSVEPLHLSPQQATMVLEMRVADRNPWKLSELQAELAGLDG